MADITQDPVPPVVPKVVLAPMATPTPTPIPTDSSLSLPPTTTAQEDVTTAGQRKINLIWEWTQAVIAVVVTFTTMGAGIYEAVKGTAMPTIVSVAFGTIIGFYFSRTNHQAIGGVGPVPTQTYIGR